MFNESDKIIEQYVDSGGAMSGPPLHYTNIGGIIFDSRVN